VFNSFLRIGFTSSSFLSASRTSGSKEPYDAREPQFGYIWYVGIYVYAYHSGEECRMGNKFGRSGRGFEFRSASAVLLSLNYILRPHWPTCRYTIFKFVSNANCILRSHINTYVFPQLPVLGIECVGDSGHSVNQVRVFFIRVYKYILYCFKNRRKGTFLSAVRVTDCRAVTI
jgi:hypothetical protein